jgi:hypothetical protein
VLNPFRMPFQVGQRKEERDLNVVMSIEGQISRAEAAKLMELARDSKPKTAIVEIGTYRGRSTAALGFGSLMGSCNRVYAVDPHEEFVGVLGGQFGPQDQAELYRNLAMANIGEVVAVVSLPSEIVARSWSERNVGLLWIDGDHRYEAVHRDYHSWSRLFIADATVAFHDK